MTVRSEQLAVTVPHELIPDFAAFGVHAFTTTRAAGTFSFSSDEPARRVAERWDTLQRDLADKGPRLASARQVHGNQVLVHSSTWAGWLRAGEADGHVAFERGTALVVSVADCVPVFVAHPSGAIGLLHSGWRGTVARIVDRGLDEFWSRGMRLDEVRVHLGPSICGSCYEVSPDVFGQLTGRSVDRPTRVDLRAIIAGHASARGVRDVAISELCTRCDNDRLFSHRAGDAGRQLGVMIAEI